MSNAKGVRVNPIRQYRMLDELPRRVRLALAHAKFDWAVNPIHREFRQGATASELVKMVAQMDAEAELEERLKVWDITPEMEAGIDCGR